MLVDSGYATFIEIAEATPEDTLDAVEVPEPEVGEPADPIAPAAVVAADEPATELPAKNAPKAEWVATADALGIDTDGMNKDEVIEAVTDVVS